MPSKRILTQLDISEIVRLFTIEKYSIKHLQNIYKTKLIKRILKSNNIILPIINRPSPTKITEQQELDILNIYFNQNQTMIQIQQKYHIGQKRLLQIFYKYNKQPRQKNDLNIRWFSPKEINIAKTLLTQSGTISILIKYFKCNEQVITRNLLRHGINPKDYSETTSSFKDKWRILYGLNAEQKIIEYSNKVSKNMSGTNNPMFGKPSPNGSGNGWKGWYKKWFFRSLRELSYALYLDEKNILWESGERIVIPYTQHNGNKGTYRPDFFIIPSKIVEIKPKRLHNSPKIIAKTKSAIEFCKTNNMTFEIIDFPINSDKIKELYLNKLIQFQPKYETKFRSFIQTQKTSV